MRASRKSHKRGFIWRPTDKLEMNYLRGLVLLHWLQCYTGLSDGNGVRGSKRVEEEKSGRTGFPLRPRSPFTKEKKTYSLTYSLSLHTLEEIFHSVMKCAMPIIVFITFSSPTNLATGRLGRSMNKPKKDHTVCISDRVFMKTKRR